MNDLGYSQGNQVSSYISVNTEFTPSWVYGYSYWTMSPYDDSSSDVWCVYNDGELYNLNYVVNRDEAVRPVITISKSALQS